MKETPTPTYVRAYNSRCTKLQKKNAAKDCSSVNKKRKKKNKHDSSRMTKKRRLLLCLDKYSADALPVRVELGRADAHLRLENRPLRRSRQLRQATAETTIPSYCCGRTTPS